MKNQLSKNDTILKKAFLTYGADAQLKMLIEESAELIQAAAKSYRSNSISFEPIIDEMADLLIVIEQFRLNLDIDTKLNERIQFKIDRLESRLNEHSSSISKS